MLKYGEIIAFNNPSQSHWEMNQLLLTLEQIKPQRIIEIGTHLGGSARVFRDVFEPKIVYTIDPIPQMDPDYNYFHIEQVVNNSQEAFAKLYMDNMTAPMMGDVWADAIDFVFIDGSHYYNDVKGDFRRYKRLVKPGGIIALHDVILQGNDTCEVYRFWEELKKEYKTITIWDGTPEGTGTGVVFL